MLALSFLLARDGSRYRPIIHDASAIEIAIENNWQDYLKKSLEETKPQVRSKL